MSAHRRTATRVKDGRVQKKNNWAASERSIHAMTQDEIHIERRDPGDGYRHVVTVAHLRAFLRLLPDWDELTVGLDAIVLDDGGRGCMGWCTEGVVAVCAWGRDLWWNDADPEFLAEHRSVLDLLGVPVVKAGRRYAVEWTEDQARAFQLLHILTHELGHHHDRITSKRQSTTGRGEPYAETYALRVMDEVWPAYARSFGV